MTKIRNHPLVNRAAQRNPLPEAWHAEVLANEIHDLTIMVRSLEFQVGFNEGRSVGRVESVLADRLTEEEPGAAAVVAH